jgi:hypothetical protein
VFRANQGPFVGAAIAEECRLHKILWNIEIFIPSLQEFIRVDYGTSFRIYVHSGMIASKFVILTTLHGFITFSMLISIRIPQH